MTRFHTLALTLLLPTTAWAQDGSGAAAGSGSGAGAGIGPPPTSAEQIASSLMQMEASVQAIAFLLGMAATFIALTVMSTYLRMAVPQRTRHARDVLDEKPIFCCVVGTVNLFFLLLLSVALSQPPTALLGVLLIIGFFSALFVGGHVKAAHMGQRAFVAMDKPPSPLAEQTIGMPILLCHTLVPIVGWAAFAYFIASGAGATIIMIARRRKNIVVLEPYEEEKPAA